jgi:hypothetical protein
MLRFRKCIYICRSSVCLDDYKTLSEGSLNNNKFIKKKRTY